MIKSLDNEYPLSIVFRYRRIVFISLLPLIASGPLRASIGFLLALVSAAASREMCPFISRFTNLLYVMAQVRTISPWTYKYLLIMSPNFIMNFTGPNTTYFHWGFCVCHRIRWCSATDWFSTWAYSLFCELHCCIPIRMVRQLFFFKLYLRHLLYNLYGWIIIIN